jgi:multidrug efflux pump subunit AcrB
VVQERLTFAYALPNVSKPPIMLNPLSATSRVMIVGISSKRLSLVELSVLNRFVMKPKLLGVPGVANVSAWGDRMRQLQVQVDPERLLRRGVTLDQVIKTAGNAMWVSPLSYLEASTPGTGGWIDTPTQRLTIQHTLPISTPDDLGQVTVEGSSLALRDVAKVVEGYPPLIGDALLNGKPGLLLVVEKLPHVDTRTVVKDWMRRSKHFVRVFRVLRSIPRSIAQRVSLRQRSTM